VNEIAQLNPREECQQAEMEQMVEDVLKTLTCREQIMLNARFWNRKTLMEIGKEHNISATRVHQITGKALRKLRHYKTLKKLDDVCPFEKRNFNA